jgi:acyl-CoA reductase-like NAD-dependent aldehyde dehydrogenase
MPRTPSTRSTSTALSSRRTATTERRAPLFNPATEQQIGEVRLGDADDVDLAVAAAKCR